MSDYKNVDIIQPSEKLKRQIILKAAWNPKFLEINYLIKAAIYSFFKYLVYELYTMKIFIRG